MKTNVALPLCWFEAYNSPGPPLAAPLDVFGAIRACAAWVFPNLWLGACYHSGRPDSYLIEAKCTTQSDEANVFEVCGLMLSVYKVCIPKK